MAVRTCRVTCIDPRGVEHTIQVSAQSLYELADFDDEAGRALPQIFAPGIFAEDTEGLGDGFIEPAVEHRVRIKDFTNWLDSAWKTPAEMTLKSRLRDILAK